MNRWSDGDKIMVFLDVQLSVLPLGLDCPLLAGQSQSLAPLEVGLVTSCKAAHRVPCFQHFLTADAVRDLSVLMEGVWSRNEFPLLQPQSLSDSAGGNCSKLSLLSH